VVKAACKEFDGMMRLTRGYILGGGNMGAAFARGVIRSGLLSAQNLEVIEPDSEKCRSFEVSLGCRTSSSLEQITKREIGEDERGSTLFVIAVKPQIVQGLLERIPENYIRRSLFLSCAAGVRLQSLVSALRGHHLVVRAMPNLPVEVGEGVVGYYPDPSVGPEYLSVVEQLLGTLGLSVPVGEESLLDAVTALSGSGPGYWSYLVNALIEQARSFGFSHRVAEQLVIKSLRGTVALLEMGEHPGALQRRVTSPGGTTERAVETLQRLGVADALKRAIQDARDRSEELGACDE
jgi:pyrroline-5-carboxylate reductase